MKDKTYPRLGERQAQVPYLEWFRITWIKYPAVSQPEYHTPNLSKTNLHLSHPQAVRTHSFLQPVTTCRPKCSGFFLALSSENKTTKFQNMVQSRTTHLSQEDSILTRSARNAKAEQMYEMNRVVFWHTELKLSKALCWVSLQHTEHVGKVARYSFTVRYDSRKIYRTLIQKCVEDTEMWWLISLF